MKPKDGPAAQRQRNKIMDAAVRCYAANDNPRLIEVATEAQLPKSTVQYYYTKDRSLTKDHIRDCALYHAQKREQKSEEDVMLLVKFFVTQKKWGLARALIKKYVDESGGFVSTRAGSSTNAV